MKVFRKLKCLLGFHTAQVMNNSDAYKKIERLRGRVRSCGADRMQCTSCGHKWLDKWSMI